MSEGILPVFLGAFDEFLLKLLEFLNVVDESVFYEGVNVKVCLFFALIIVFNLRLFLNLLIMVSFLLI